MKSPSLLVLVLMATLVQFTTNALHPIVIIPGSGGNQLEARLNQDYYKSSSLFCRLTGKKDKDGWFRLWFDPTVLLAPLTRCFAERMTLCYHREIDDYRNAPGVETRVPGFGSTEGIRYLDPYLKHISEYMATLISSLEKIGYKEGSTLFGAPYDFRYGLAPRDHPAKVGSKYLKDLQQLIESAFASNGAKPVILLTHSLGGLFALQFLARAEPPWRAKHIKHLLAVSAPWGGTVQEMLTFGSGYTLGIPLVNPLLVRDEQRSSESNMWLLPSPALFGFKVLVIDTSNNKTYTARDMPEFLTDIGYENGMYPYSTRVLPLVSGLPDPGVNVTCLVGCGVDTPETLVYGRGGFDVAPKVVYGDGDGTVNIASLLWLQSEFRGVKVVRVPGMSHTSILKDDIAVRKIIGEICDINSVDLSYVV
ncbi:uncharacterized protein A4U43_C08F16580 [Asparagus officinalis]|uniref:lecithin-cholesterol acyltransferase-like 1 n=1 Tax=Asparagus officinalis TaxID=4686 RepID=UPI00098E3FDF|nr:lecithin-cholesterol acyltransferase-like 1 [Asparagus officinalis]ONK60290.1 uncharacterized protein A4U43_C08F16580 [Asparagus officinalis]